MGTLSLALLVMGIILMALVFLGICILVIVVLSKMRNWQENCAPHNKF